MSESEGAGILEREKVSEAELEVLTGDKVGDTVYSSRWILNVLLELSQVQETGWSEKLESTLCALWDMSAEKEVAHYLAENDFLKIATQTLNASEEPRLTEVVAGIVGNLSCDSELLDKISLDDELVDTMLRLLSSDDTATLLQILRFLSSVVWRIKSMPASTWRSKLQESTLVREALPFILKSSTNEELLISTTSFLRSCEEIESRVTRTSTWRSFLVDLYEPNVLLPGLLESFNEVLPSECDELHLTSGILRFLDDFLTLLTSILRSGTRYMEKETATDDIHARILQIVQRILTAFADPWNLLPLDEVKASCVYSCLETVRTCRNQGHDTSNTICDILRAVVRISWSIKAALEKQQDEDEETEGKKEEEEEEEEEEELKETLKELQQYVVSYWIETGRISNIDEIIGALKNLEKQTVDYSIDVLRTSDKIPKERLDDLTSRICQIK